MTCSRTLTRPFADLLSFSLLSVRFNTLFRAFFLLLYSVFNEQFRTFRLPVRSVRMLKLYSRILTWSVWMLESCSGVPRSYPLRGTRSLASLPGRSGCSSHAPAYRGLTRFAERALSHPYLVGLDGLGPSTSRLSGARSSHLSYRPVS